MDTDQLVSEITRFCRHHEMAESTFGRVVANDGKLVARLRDGKSITLKTLKKVEDYMSAHDGVPADAHAANGNANGAADVEAGAPGVVEAIDPESTKSERNFRFFDNRQKYLLFVNTCSEKWVVANRVSMELANIHPKPPAIRLFDAGVGDGTVLTRVMRAMHARFPTMPHLIAGKEISLEDIRLTVEKMPDRFYEHPASVVVLTNMFYSEAPWLRVHNPAAANSLVWEEVPLRGSSSFDFEEQLTALEPFLAENWKAKAHPRTGNPVYERPVVLVLYREDHKFLLDSVIPRPGATRADYDLVIASQPYRLRVPARFKAEKVVAPLARALGPGGRLIGIHSHGDDPGLEIIRNVWPDENPFENDRHDILKSTKDVLGSAGRDLKFNAYSDARSIFRYDMHTLPNELEGPIGTSTLFAAWNAAIYVNQIEDERLNEAVRDGIYLDATRDVLRKHGGLWFHDESFVISKKMG
ncbi:hypothetical protein [Amorphus orientalis]|uniref:SAM-dependent methyltransferase n=1 Tax=Amorphus orientalis TaxID=649198 RepID=A0AAE4AS95_9HYPH|nr:hypothetical protein [Amorphus orientalis]MDQ0314790.1 SAM-dependent methyltransferase [Amorphus orientalis]